jgi:nucleotide-binding universal stress UspA family protein
VVDYGYRAPQYATALIASMREKGKTVLAAAVSEARKYGVNPQAALLETVAGPSAELIVGHAKDIGADLIVMGTHGRRGLRRLALGSDAEQVVRLAGIPVLLIRGEISPADSLRATEQPSTTAAPSLELG